MQSLLISGIKKKQKQRTETESKQGLKIYFEAACGIKGSSHLNTITKALQK